MIRDDISIKINILIVICIMICGCGLEDMKEYGPKCPDGDYTKNLAYIKTDNGNKTVYKTDADNPYNYLFEKNRCPKNYQCGVDLEGSYYCMQCSEGLVACNGSCIDPKESKEYCGAFGLCVDKEGSSRGEKCTGELSCKAGKCECAGNDKINCGGECIDPKTSKDYCGASGLCDGTDGNSKGEKCDGLCSDGVCISVEQCDEKNGYKKCKIDGVNEECVSIMDNSKHCGKCGNECRGDLACYGGQCACPSSEKTACGNDCFDLKVEHDHCGTCENICKEYQSCRNGQCGCGEGEEDCGTECVDLKTDEDNCGGCGNKCNDGNFCIDGTCQSCKDNGYFVIDIDFDGKKVTPFCIQSEEQMIELQDALNKGEKYPSDNSNNAYILTKDLNLESWSSINSFKDGYFDGNNKVITVKEFQNCTTSEGCGFFGTTENSVIQNVQLYMNINDSKVKHTGVLIGDVKNSIIDNNVVLTTNVVSSRDRVGGLVGYLERSEIRNSTVCIEGKMSGFEEVGGMVGHVTGDDKKESLIVNSNVYLNGVLSGNVQTTNCDSLTNGEESYAGFAGFASGKSTFKDCEVTNEQSSVQLCKSILNSTNNRKAIISGIVNNGGGFVSGTSDIEGVSRGAIFDNCKVKINSIEACWGVGGFSSALGSSQVYNSSVELDSIKTYKTGASIGGFVNYVRKVSLENSSVLINQIESNQGNSSAFISWGEARGKNENTQGQIGVSIKNCRATVTSITGDVVGGIIADSSRMSSKIENTGVLVQSMKGQSLMGSFVGDFRYNISNSDNIEITNSYVIVYRYYTKNNDIGGFIGKVEGSIPGNISISNSYTIGVCSGPCRYGGLFNSVVSGNEVLRDTELSTFILGFKDKGIYYFKRSALSPVCDSGISSDDYTYYDDNMYFKVNDGKLLSEALSISKDWGDARCKKINYNFFYPVLRDNVVEGCEIVETE